MPNIYAHGQLKFCGLLLVNECILQGLASKTSWIVPYSSEYDESRYKADIYVQLDIVFKSLLTRRMCISKIQASMHVSVRICAYVVRSMYRYWYCWDCSCHLSGRQTSRNNPMTQAWRSTFRIYERSIC